MTSPLYDTFLTKLADGLEPSVSMPLKEFVRQAFKIPQPAEYKHNWHIDVICDHLEAIQPNRQIRNLLINMPPRMAKSLTVSIFWPAWVWTVRPDIRFLYSSYSRELSTDHSVACRNVIQSEWYQRNWESVFQLKGDQNRKTVFENNMGGYRIATSVGGAAIGFGGNVIVVDDPHNIIDYPSKIMRDTVIMWWTQIMSTRLNDPKRDARVIVMQRMHTEDLAGYVLENMEEDWEQLILPNEYDPKRMISMTNIGWVDPRTEDKELLFEERFGEKETIHQRRELGSPMYNAQYQQDPTNEEGGIFKRRWWKFYEVTPMTIKGSLDFHEVIQSWDMNYKDTGTSDYAVGQVWGRRGADKYLLDQVRERYPFNKCLEALQRMQEKWPMCTAILVEDKANGRAVIETLKHKIAGIIPVNPEGGKVSRANAIQPQVESGNVYLPTPRLNPWVEDFIDEFSNATPEGGGRFWDQIDAATQALVRLNRPIRRTTWGRKSTGIKSGTRRVTFGRSAFRAKN